MNRPRPSRGKSAPPEPEWLDSLPEETEEPWSKNRKMVKRGFPDLQYLPKARTGWNATLAALAFALRRQLDGRADLNTWASMHGCVASARYADLGSDALVLWHGTSEARAERIKEVGLFHKKGLWTTMDPRVAHGYTRGRAGSSGEYGAGSATIVLVLDRRELTEGVHYSHEGPSIHRFHSGMDARYVEYICWADRVEFRGSDRAAEPSPWGRARFKRQGGSWVPLSRPPVRLDADVFYNTFDEWLELSLRRVLSVRGSATALEVFSSLYATLDPWAPLEHEEILLRLESLSSTARPRGAREFSLEEE